MLFMDNLKVVIVEASSRYLWKPQGLINGAITNWIGIKVDLNVNGDAGHAHVRVVYDVIFSGHKSFIWIENVKGCSVSGTGRLLLFLTVE